MEKIELRFISTVGLADAYNLANMLQSKNPSILVLASKIKANFDVMEFVRNHPEAQNYSADILEAYFLETLINDGWSFVSADIGNKKYLLQRKAKAEPKENA